MVNSVELINCYECDNFYTILNLKSLNNLYRYKNNYFFKNFKKTILDKEYFSGEDLLSNTEIEELLRKI